MVALVVRMVVSLAVVLALMYVAARLLNRTNRSRGGARVVSLRRPARGVLAARKAAPAPWSAGLEVVGHRPLGKGASVALVRAADRNWLVGVTESSVRLLSELPPEVEEISDDVGLAAVTGPVAPASAPVSLLDQLRERTVRRA